jgi:hypothetical protein
MRITCSLTQARADTWWPVATIECAMLVESWYVTTVGYEERILEVGVGRD